MIQTATLFDAPHIKSLSKGNKKKCLIVAHDYALDSSLPIFDRGRNAIEKEIGSSTLCRQRDGELIFLIISLGCHNKLQG